MVVTHIFQQLPYFSPKGTKRRRNQEFCAVSAAAFVDQFNSSGHARSFLLSYSENGYINVFETQQHTRQKHRREGACIPVLNWGESQSLSLPT